MTTFSSSPSVQVRGLAFTGYPVTDMTRARAFYENLLGLKPATTFEHEGKAWIEYDIGTSTLAITNTSSQWKPSPDGPCVAMEVDNFDDAVKALREAGVPFYVEPLEFPSCRFTVASDPDGNSVAIHQRRA